MSHRRTHESGDSALDRPHESEVPRGYNPENAPLPEPGEDMPTLTPEQSAGSQGQRG